MNQQQYYPESGGYRSGAAPRHHRSQARHGPQQSEEDIDIYAEQPYDPDNDPSLMNHRSHPRHSSSRGHHTSQQQPLDYGHRHERSDHDTASRLRDSGQRNPENNRLTNHERTLEPRYVPERRFPEIYPNPNDDPFYLLETHHSSTQHARNYRHEAEPSPSRRSKYCICAVNPEWFYECYARAHPACITPDTDSTHRHSMGELGHRSIEQRSKRERNSDDDNNIYDNVESALGESLSEHFEGHHGERESKANGSRRRGRDPYDPYQ